MEVFSGEYRMKMPLKQNNDVKKSGSKTQVTEVSTDHFSIKANTDEEAHAQATFKLPADQTSKASASSTATFSVDGSGCNGVVPKPPKPPETTSRSAADSATSNSVVVNNHSSFNGSSSTTTCSQKVTSSVVTSSSTTVTSKQETHVQGHTFNITKGLRRSQHGSKDDVRKSRNISGTEVVHRNNVDQHFCWKKMYNVRSKVQFTFLTFSLQATEAGNNINSRLEAT